MVYCYCFSYGTSAAFCSNATSDTAAISVVYLPPMTLSDIFMTVESMQLFSVLFDTIIYDNVANCTF